MYDPTKPYKKRIFELISKTWNNPYISVSKDIYPVIIKNFNYPEIDHSDGIGGKGVYHWQKRTFKNAVIDALAMNLNDLALMRAIPYKLQNHIIIPQDDTEAILEIISNMSDICSKRKIAMTGGETSIHSNIEGMDIGMTMSGIIKTEKPNEIVTGDTLVGFKSSGLHSNGFSKIKEVFGVKYRREFTVPTEIYLDTILDLDSKYSIHGLMHMTGGSYTKLLDIINSDTDLEIGNSHQLQPQEIFKDLYNAGVTDDEMYKTFNCGVGFIISVSAKDAKNIVSIMPKDTAIIGYAVQGKGKVKINSSFSNKVVIY